jgi:hypothetical protein
MRPAYTIVQGHVDILRVWFSCSSFVLSECDKYGCKGQEAFSVQSCSFHNSYPIVSKKLTSARSMLLFVYGCDRVSRVAQSLYCLATGWTTGGDRGSMSGRGGRIFPLASVSKPALWPTQPPVQWVPGALSPGLKRGRGMTLTTHPHLVPRSRTSRSYTSSPPSAFMACSGTSLMDVDGRPHLSA